MSLRLSGGRRLQSPAGERARPTAARVRQAVINLLAMELPGCRWLDLCCGSGVMACEALQRGASRVVAVERDRRIAAVAQANLSAVAAGLRRPGAPPSIEVVQAEVLTWLGRPRPGDGACREARAMDDGSRGQGGAGPGSPAGEARHDAAGPIVKQPSRGFDLIYADPPWPDNLHTAIATAVARAGWLSAGGILMWECPSDRVPAPPDGWRLRDSRRYGGSTVVLLEAEA